jgi:hypothetical protein
MKLFFSIQRDDVENLNTLFMDFNRKNREGLFFPERALDQYSSALSAQVDNLPK